MVVHQGYLSCESAVMARPSAVDAHLQERARRVVHALALRLAPLDPRGAAVEVLAALDLLVPPPGGGSDVAEV